MQLGHSTKIFFCSVPLLYGCDHFLFTKQLGTILFIRHTQCPIFSFFFLWRRGSFCISDFCCLNGSVTHDIQDGELWWIASAAEPIKGEHGEETTRTGTRGQLGCMSAINFCQAQKETQKESHLVQIFCVLFDVFLKYSPCLFSSEARLQKMLESSYTWDVKIGVQWAVGI